MSNKPPLTKEDTAGKMSWAECIRYYRPDWSDEQCDYFLWNETCYPFDGETTLKQINETLSTTLFGEDEPGE
jgi:hypothetical protein